MRRLGVVLALSTPMLMSAADAADVKLAYVGEISGSIAVSGGNFRDGIILAVEEINAKGGILKDKIALTPIRHPDQSRRRPLADAEGDRRRSLRRPRADLLRQRQGHLAAGEAGGDPAIHRRRGGRADHPGQSVHVPDLVRPADRHAEDRQLHPRRAQGEDDRADLGEQRLRQGRPRPADEGDGRAQHQARRRRLHRIRARPISPPTSSSSRRRTPTRSSSTATRRSARASCARRASRASRGRSSAIRRCSARRPSSSPATPPTACSAMSASPPTRRSPRSRNSRRGSRSGSTTSPITTASRATPPSTR